MVFSELIANADLIDEHSTEAPEIKGDGADRLSGLQLVKGKASGYAVFPPASRENRTYGCRRYRGGTAPGLFRL